MNHTVSWLDKSNTVLLVKFEDDYSSKDIVEITREVQRLLGTVYGLVHLIIDVSHVVHNQEAMSLIVPELARLGFERIGEMMVVGGTSVLTEKVALYSSAFGGYVHTAETIEEASAKLFRMKAPVSII